jgi:FkbM family methyltransferase
MSQFGEHLDIEEIVGTMPHGYACDVGAYDGTELSNTIQLEQRGWDVLCVEANPMCAARLTMTRKLVRIVACGKENLERQDFFIYEIEREGNYSAISSLHPDENRPVHRDAQVSMTLKVPVRTLDWLLESVKFPRLDVLTIDVEGSEADVLAGFTVSRWRPKVIVVEDWYGGRHRAWMADHGYRMFRKREINEVYVHRESAGQRTVADVAS